MPTPYFVHVVGPYDDTFVGPFLTIDDAAAYLRDIDHTLFSPYILTASQYADNVHEFGAAPLHNPEGYIQ